MKLGLVAAVGTALLVGTSVRANFIAIYAANALNVYSYTLRFTVDQAGETLRSGDTVTLYDVPRSNNVTDITAVSAPNSPAGMFTVSQQPTGITPSDLVGAAGITDSALRQNITFTYTGPNRTASQDFTGAVIIMTPNYTNVRVGKESGSTEIGFNLSTDGGFHQDTSIRTVLLPSDLGGEPDTPEPGTLAVMGLGMAVMVVRRRRSGNATWSPLM